MSAPGPDGSLRVDPGPFDLAGAGEGAEAGRAAALCLHGLSGTPYEVRPLGEALAGRGIRAVGPLLPGHGETPQVLRGTPYTAWTQAVLAAWRRLRVEHERVHVVGLSLGGLLGLWLAAQEGDADALVVVGTPLRLRSPAVRLVPAAKRLVPYARKRTGSDIRDPEARQRHPSLPLMPLASVHELLRLQGRVRGGLPRVRAPILVAHGRLDATAHPDDARAIAAAVASPERQLLWLDRSGHVVPVDRDGPALAEAVGEFLARPRRALRYVGP